jgi:hypothetical protein
VFPWVRRAGLFFLVSIHENHLTPARRAQGLVVKMPFGRYKGIELAALPDDYVIWLAGLDDLREPLRAALETEYHLRFGWADETPTGAGVFVVGYNDGLGCRNGSQS